MTTNLIKWRLLERKPSDEQIAEIRAIPVAATPTRILLDAFAFASAQCHDYGIPAEVQAQWSGVADRLRTAIVKRAAFAPEPELTDAASHGDGRVD
jgi:hypothetical protein